VRLVVINKLPLWISTLHPTKFEQIQAIIIVASIKLQALSEIKFLNQLHEDLLKLLHNFIFAAN